MASKTICDIVEAVQDGEPVDELELRKTLLSLFYCLQMSCPSDYADQTKLQLEWRAKENFEQYWRVLRTTPDTWLGDRWAPGTENAPGKLPSERAREIFASQGIAPGNMGEILEEHQTIWRVLDEFIGRKAL
jgi:hypothetical protein